MIRKRVITNVAPVEGHYVSKLFQVGKKRWGNHPVINLKELNPSIPYTHFKKEGTHVLKELLLPEDLICKIHLKKTFILQIRLRNTLANITKVCKIFWIFVE